MSKYTGIVAAAFVTYVALDSVNNLNPAVLDHDEDGVFQVREAIKSGFLEQLDASVHIDVRENETLRFIYPAFILSIPCVNEERINLGNCGALYVDLHNSSGQYIGRKDIQGAISANLVNKGAAALAGLDTKSRRF